MNIDNSSCFKTSDSKDKGCPARMSDARAFTDYRPSNYINDLIRADNNISNSLHYRVFLQANANALMDKHRQVACQQNCCGPCGVTEGFQNSTMLPEQYMFVTDGRTSKMVLNDVNGLGTGRQYYTFSRPNENCSNLPSAWPLDQASNQCASPMDNFNYIGDIQPTPTGMRQAIPGGGVIMSQ